ncbi:hypothetical protein [Candidatus Borrarchaeum sp.]|uniref:hypothetical protein n=1 Tax=Candidatus Borrarchaeum sp. TaxID=2846742 RepID=UPI0025795930|nr:hypothetical protein [Candidatus Borrarchaeum sp.]
MGILSKFKRFIQQSKDKSTKDLFNNLLTVLSNPEDEFVYVRTLSLVDESHPDPIKDSIVENLKLHLKVISGEVEQEEILDILFQLSQSWDLLSYDLDNKGMHKEAKIAEMFKHLTANVIEVLTLQKNTPFRLARCAEIAEEFFEKDLLKSFCYTTGVSFLQFSSLVNDDITKKNFLEEATHYHKLAISLSEDIDEAYALNSNSLGIIFLQLSEIEMDKTKKRELVQDAINSMKEALDAVLLLSDIEKIEDFSISVAHAYSKLIALDVSLRIKKDAYQAMIKYYHKALEIAQEKNKVSDQIEYEYSIGSIFLYLAGIENDIKKRTGYISEAELYFQRVTEIAQKHKHLEGLQDYLKGLEEFGYSLFLEIVETEPTIEGKKILLEKLIRIRENTYQVNSELKSSNKRELLQETKTISEMYEKLTNMYLNLSAKSMTLRKAVEFQSKSLEYALVLKDIAEVRERSNILSNQIEWLITVESNISVMQDLLMSAIQTFKNLLSIINTLNDKTVEEVSYCTLALLQSVFAVNEPDSEEKNSKLTSALNFSSEGLKRAIENKNAQGIARNYYVMGTILTNVLSYTDQLQKENLYIKAKNCLYESLKLSFSMNDEKQSQKCYQVLGRLSMSFSKVSEAQDKIEIMEEALGYWDKALEIALKLNDFVSLPIYSFAAGKCWFAYTKLENDPRIQSNYCSNALQKFDETIKYGRRLGNTDIMLKASENMLDVMAFENKVLLETKTQIRTFKID